MDADGLVRDMTFVTSGGGGEITANKDARIGQSAPILFRERRRMHDPSSLRVAAETDDASVIANSRHDSEWFSVIFDRYFAAIHRYAAARLGPTAADDVAAETFLAGFDQRDRYDLTRPEAKAWLYGITTNLISRHRRDELRLYRALSRSAARDDIESHADRVTDRVTAEQLSPRLARAAEAVPG